MSTDFDVKLTALAAEILRDAVRVYDPQQSEALLMGVNPLLSAWNTGSFMSLTVTGAFPVVTGLLPAVPSTQAPPAAAGGTSAFQPFTRPFRALTESFRALGQEPAEPAITLRRVFRLPGQLPGISLPAETELGVMARFAPTMMRLDQLAQWLGQDGRLVTGTEKLTSRDAAEATQLLGLSPESLFLLWENALTSSWFELADSADRQQTKAVSGQAAWCWSNGDDQGALHAWAAVFAAVAARSLDNLAAADPGASRKLNFQGQGVALVVLLFLARRTGMTVKDVEALVQDSTIGEYPSSRVKRSWQAWVRKHGDPAHRLLQELADLHAVVLPGGSQNVELTPLAHWALREQFELEDISVPVLPPVSSRMAAAHLVTLSDAVSEAEFDAAFASWIAGHDPDQAARELLIYAGSVGPEGRLAAVGIARRIGAPAYRAWQDATRSPELRGYARITLSRMAADLPDSVPPPALEPDPDDTAWLATDLLALACGADEPDPDEVATLFAEAVPAGEERVILALMTQSSHPDAARVLRVLGDYHPDRRLAREARKAARAVTKGNRIASGRRSPARAVGV
jgi:hypothetical protein